MTVLYRWDGRENFREKHFFQSIFDRPQEYIQQPLEPICTTKIHRCLRQFTRYDCIRLGKGLVEAIRDVCVNLIDNRLYSLRNMLILPIRYNVASDMFIILSHSGTSEVLSNIGRNAEDNIYFSNLPFRRT